MIELSPELKARKERYKELGLLRENGRAPKVKVLSLGERSLVFQFGWSSSFAWDDYTAKGTVHTTIFGIRKVSDLSQTRDEADHGWHILVGPIVFAFALC